MKHRIFPIIVSLWLGSHLVAVGQDAAIEAEGAVAESETTAAETKDSASEISDASQSYVAAFNARDVAKLVSHWCPEGVYVSRSSGEQVVGREAMTDEFTAVFADESTPKLVSVTDSIDFISPNVAVERGSAKVIRGEDDVVESTYTVVYIKSEGKWLIDRVTEDDIVSVPSNYDQLKELEWLVGAWVDRDEGISIDIDCQWTSKKNYLSRRYTVSNEEGAQSSGLQIIGWDPQQKQIRSWLFDSDGGFIRGTWTHRDDRWIVQSVATLPDGRSGSFASVFRPSNDGNYTWQKINRVLDGKLLPNIDEIVVLRK